MTRKLAVSALFVISIALNFRSALLFSRQNSRFLRDFEQPSSESVLSSSSSSSSDSNDSSEDAIIVTGSENAKLNATKVLHEDEGLRQHLCSADHFLMRYDLRVGQCYEIDTRAHCGKNMIFKEEINSSSYGYCECDFENHEVPLVFHLPSNTCFPIYSQGYCQPGEWLILSKKAKGPACQRNQCLRTAPTLSKRMPTGRGSRLIIPWIWESFSSSGHEPVIKINDNRRKSMHPSIMSRILVPLNGDGPCLPLGLGSKFCQNANDRVIFSQGDFLPRCGPGRSFRRLSIIPNACPPGSYYSIIGYCQPVWDF